MPTWLSPTPRSRAVSVAVAWLLFAAAPLRAQQPTGSLEGVVTDAATGSILSGAAIELPQLGRGALSDGEGRFSIASVPAGTWTVRVRRLGYGTMVGNVEVTAQSVATLTTALHVTAARLDRVVVSGRAGDRALLAPTTQLEGAELDRSLRGSIAAAIAAEPGVSQRYNGPMAAQPVIRGLAGDRVAVLEDGMRTGDLASTAPDHAVTIDPLTARRIEIVRGPAGVIFGGNTLGGAVNVVREDVPQLVPQRTRISLATQGESVNNGIAGSASVDAAPLDWVSIRAAGTARRASDTRTPGGALPFTDLAAHELTLGASAIRGGSFVGAAVRDQRASYGVPSSFGGVTLPGAHDGGVYVDLQRTSGRVEARLAREERWRSVEARGNWVRYDHAELERGGFVGTRFGQLMASGEVIARHESHGSSGALGTTVTWRDMRAAGSYTGTRPAELITGGAFVLHELAISSARILAAARYDHTRIVPLDSTETRLLQNVHTREFGALTGSLAVTIRAPRGWEVGASASRAARAPAIEELYSAGPHLASYAYEVGNPMLGEERGIGVDVFARTSGERLSAELTLFRTHIDGYVHYAPVMDSATGMPMRDPRLRRYVVYRAAQTDAGFDGVESRMRWRAAGNLFLDATISWVRASNPHGEPLPAIPPLNGILGLRRESSRWFAGGSLDLRAAQNRTPERPTGGARCDATARNGEAESLPAEFCPTPGAALVDVTGGVRWSIGGRLHALTLSVDNLLDSTWRDHLWRAKQVAPQPGRNVRLLYRVTL